MADMIGFSKTAQTKKPSRKKTINVLDDLIRQIVLTGDQWTCCCCGRVFSKFHPKTNPHGIQLGHYISRTVWPLRWDLRNCHPQCSGCNRKHEDNPLDYTLFMLRTYGEPMLVEFKKIHLAYQQIGKTMPTPELLEKVEELKKVLSLEKK